MKTLYLDCFAGMSGNMMLGTLLDLGLPKEYLKDQLSKLPVSGYEIVVKNVMKQGIKAIYVDVVEQGEGHGGHGHDDHAHHNNHDYHHDDNHSHGHEHEHSKQVHHHGQQGFRCLSDILQLLESSPLDAEIKRTSEKIFYRLAEAEAKVHGLAVQDVHFHEVGAIDTIVDVVGTAIGLHYLEIEAIYVSRVRVGWGFVNCAHGRMPIPAPATAELLLGVPYYAGDIEREMTTPTGAAIIAALASGFGDMPAGFSTKIIGYGAGTWDLAIPNAVRGILGAMTEAAGDETWVIEANIDDMSPEIYGFVTDMLLTAGALDVWITPVLMKKGRPAHVLSILALADKITDMQRILFAETTTIGVRQFRVQRSIAKRDIVTVTTSWGKVRVKRAYYQGQLCNIAPEYDDCRQLAVSLGIPLKSIYQAAQAGAAQEQDD